MELIRGADELRAVAEAHRDAGDPVGLVPTMGALHEGHASLIRRARAERAFVAVSIFVNPLQFAPGEDLERYPRDEARDRALCERLGVDVVWAPPVEEFLPPAVELPEPDPGPSGDVFEGAARPGHFRGVLKVVLRLFDVAGPCAAYFGEKDAQQLHLVRRMVQDLALPVEIVACPTVREADGVAVSSRNAFLDPMERGEAPCLFMGLSEAAALARNGERNAAALVATIAREVGAAPVASLDYAAVVDDRTFEPVSVLGGGVRARAIVAAGFPSARLIDNLLVPDPA
jgi:pantoate--beta-alanine ligase